MTKSRCAGFERASLSIPELAMMAIETAAMPRQAKTLKRLRMICPSWKRYNLEDAD
jgi:hypothetical protein